MTTVADMLVIDAAGVSEMKSVADYGVDSLIAAELRNWINVTFGTNINARFFESPDEHQVAGWHCG